MTKIGEVQKQIKELRLQKRQLLLSGRETGKVAYEIEELEEQLKLLNSKKE